MIDDPALSDSLSDSPSDSLSDSLSLPADVSLLRLAELLVGMANGQGGTLLLWLDRQNVEEAIDRVRQASLLAVPILILPRPHLITERSALSIQVPRGLAHVYALDGRYLLRHGETTRPLTSHDLRQLLIERGEISFEEELQREASINDLDWSAVETYASQSGVRRESPFDLLVRRGCLIERNGKFIPTNAGVLLFGRDPQRFVRSARITAVRFAGTAMGDVFMRQDLGGTLPDQIRRAETFLLDNLRRDVRLRAQMERSEQLEYPMEAARELVVNAVAHRDYNIAGDDIRMFLFADRMEVTSPGKLAGPVTLENIVEERFSRNPAIVQVLADMGFIERLGYGVDRVIALMQSHHLPAPTFTESSGGFRVALRNNLLVGAPPGVDDPPITALELPTNINARQEAALIFLRQGNPRITNGDLQAMFPSVHAETIRRDLADLVAKLLLVKRGEKRGSFYTLSR